MDWRNDENPYRRQRPPLFPGEAQIPDSGSWPGRGGVSPHDQIQNERATRRLLAEEVYRVPDALLDDVIRVRMADLNR